MLFAANAATGICTDCAQLAYIWLFLVFGVHSASRFSYFSYSVLYGAGSDSTPTRGSYANGVFLSLMVVFGIPCFVSGRPFGLSMLVR